MSDSSDLLSTEKILGMYWHPGDDAFKYELKFHRVERDIIEGTRHPTKREMLKVIMSIFDPMGFLCHYMISAKLLMREVWRYDIRWDDVLPVALHDLWSFWRSDLKNVSRLHIPRCYFVGGVPSNLELHILVDASEDAFGVVGYWRYVGDDSAISVSFVAAKTKCAPLKAMTIPGLELQAAVLGTRLMCTILKEHTVKVTRVICWSDSSTVVSWIRSESRRYKPFVAHRITEILDSTRPGDWRWLLNIADETTRTKSNVDFSFNTRWFKGPDFLYKDVNEWPEDSAEQNLDPEEELRPKFGLLVSNNCIIDYFFFPPQY